jgi:cyclopropane-fatty-acyl-phospholipid synthase
MSRPPASIRADYKTVRGLLRRDLIARTFELLFPKICFEIDFQDGDVRKIGSGVSTLKVAPPSLLEICKILLNPNFRLPESFVNGKWFVSEGELAEFVVLMTRRTGAKANNSGIGMGIRNFVRHIYKQYLHVAATREARHHYNKDPRIYEIVLGPSMIYSCAFFNSEDHKLEDAQSNKLKTTLTRLLAGAPVQNILDIGCGWGGFVLFASQNTEAQIDGISIAQSQIEYATKEAMKLEKTIRERVHFFCEDYVNFKRNHFDLYDRIVSIGMLEHVGKTQYSRYFGEIRRLLRSGGIALVHSITRSDTGITNEWIDRYVFPGGYVPRMSEVVRGIENAGLRVETCFRHDGYNYKKTLQCWLENLGNREGECLAIFSQQLQREHANAELVERNSRRAYRIWYFYLSSIQCIFDQRGGAYDVTQLVIRKF